MYNYKPRKQSRRHNKGYESKLESVIFNLKRTAKKNNDKTTTDQIMRDLNRVRQSRVSIFLILVFLFKNNKIFKFSFKRRKSIFLFLFILFFLWNSKRNMGIN